MIDILLYCRVLSSDAVLSTDEESSGEEASDLDELGKDLESMLSNKKNKHEVFDCFIISFHLFHNPYF